IAELGTTIELVPRLEVTAAVLALVEVTAAVLALAAVALGGWAAFRHDWLLSRCKAELLRARKFEYLIDPASWSLDPVAVLKQQARLVQDAQEIDHAAFRDLDRWIDATDVFEPPEPPPDPAEYASELGELVAYYRLKRLGKQGWFYFDRAHRNDRLDLLTRRLPQFAFFGSVLLATLHFILGAACPVSVSVEGGAATCGRSVGPGTLLVMLAAALPVLGAGIRTVRGAHEFGRNRLRYQAVY